MTAAALLFLAACAAAEPAPAPAPAVWSAVSFARWDRGRAGTIADAGSSRLAAAGAGWTGQYGGTAVVRPAEPAGAWTLGWRMERGIGKYLGMDLGLGWTGWGDSTGRLGATGANGETMEASERSTASAVTVGAGCWMRTPALWRWSLGLRASIGPCWGSTSRVFSSSFYDPVNDVESAHEASANARGTGWQSEVSLELERSFGSTAVFVSAAYRRLRVERLRYVRSADFDGDGWDEVTRGQRVVDGAGQPVPLSASGALLAFGFRVAL